MIFGADDRVEIAPTTAPPWSSVVALQIFFPLGEVAATGVMIGPNDLLTVGHAVYSAQYGGYATSILASPGRDGGSDPYGIASSVSFQVDPRWVAGEQNGDPADPFGYDYALVTLDRAIGNASGFLPVGVLNDPVGVSMAAAGYPADKGFDFLYRTDGTVDAVDIDTLFFDDDLDLLPGQSGSPVYATGAGPVTVSGLISFDFGEEPFSNGVLRITPEYRETIAWWSATNDVTDGPDFVLGGPTGEMRNGLDGADTMTGMDGADTLYGGAANDDLNGNLGDDLVQGQTGADLVRGGQGADTVYGGAGDDWHLNGNRGADRVFGNVGNDAVFGGAGADTLEGGEGADTLSGDLGDDLLTGGAGADLFYFGSGQGRDRIADFEAGGGDVIRLASNLNGSGIRTAADALARLVADGAGALLDLGAGNDLRIAGILPTVLTVDDFSIV